MNWNPAPPFSPFSGINPLTAKYARTYKIARQNLLLLLVFTAINLVLLVANSDIMFLFSAITPYFIAQFGIELAEYIPASMGICFVIALAILAVYLLCYLFSKKSFGWIIAALVLFSIDSVMLLGLMLLGLGSLGVFDLINLAFHGWVLYYLISGVNAGAKLKTSTAVPGGAFPTEQTLQETLNIVSGPAMTGKVFSNFSVDGSDSLPLRPADPGVKAKILLESDAAGHHLCYRRVKRVNELVIDGNVYAEVSMLMETAHTLSARCDGHVFSANFDGQHSYLMMDGAQLAKKLRLI